MLNNLAFLLAFEALQEMSENIFLTCKRAGQRVELSVTWPNFPLQGYGATSAVYSTPHLGTLINTTQ
jgi:hypothetical protein